MEDCVDTFDGRCLLKDDMEKDDGGYVKIFDICGFLCGYFGFL